MNTPSLRQYGLRPIVILFILNAIDEFDRAVVAVALDDVREHFNVSDATIGLLPLAVIFITGSLSLPAGNLADRWSRRKILVIGAVIWGSAGLRLIWHSILSSARLRGVESKDSICGRRQACGSSRSRACQGDTPMFVQW